MTTPTPPPPPSEPVPGPAPQPPADGPEQFSLSDTSGFFSSLFDWNFKKFITLGVLQVLYIIGVILIALSVVLGMITAVMTMIQTSVIGGLISLLIAPVAGLLGILWLRISLELVAVIFRIGQNTSIMVADNKSVLGSFRARPGSDV